MKRELSILIPSRNEQFLSRTIQDILGNIEADTEIIAVLDGELADPPIEQNDRVNVIYLQKSIGQRAATNLAASLSEAKYVMKVDAHCAFDKGFDRKMIEKMQDDWTMVPTMRNLWAFDWKCFNCGWKKYQGPTPEKCENCGKTGNIRKKMMWVGKERPQSNSYCFDAEPHFQYFNEYTKRDSYKKDLEETGLTETMSLQGSCFMSTREKYWELGLSDEALGNWGNQGIEVSMKTRLSGGKVMVNHNTWYAHMFRTQGGDFSFPYEQKGREVAKTKERVKDLFWKSEWDKQIYPLSYVVRQFWPIPGWTERQLEELIKYEADTKRSGIYKITCKKNNKVYIGSAEVLKRRLNAHIKMLERNDHKNQPLQNAWNKYGEKSFEFEVLRFCPKEYLLKYEQEYINRFKREIGWDNMFNLNLDAKSWLGRKHTEESKQKMSISKKGKEAWNKGIKHTEETKQKISKAKKGNEP